MEGPARRAEVLALLALNFLAADEDRFSRFMLTTGLDEQALRAGAAEPAFLGGILDFLLGDEPLLVAFSSENELNPLDVTKARTHLPGYCDAS